MLENKEFDKIGGPCKTVNCCQFLSENRLKQIMFGTRKRLPILWWQKKFKNYYRIDKNINFSTKGIPPLYSLNDDPIYKLIFWRRI